MSTVRRRYRFVVDDGIALDLHDVYARDPDDAADIIVLIEEIKADASLCERLIDVGYEDEQIRHVKLFQSLQTEGYNSYTVRLCEVDDWRLITAVDHQQREIALLYIMLREENYNDQVKERVIAAYEKLSLRRLGR